jgi:hypothetical protein
VVISAGPKSQTIAKTTMGKSHHNDMYFWEVAINPDPYCLLRIPAIIAVSINHIFISQKLERIYPPFTGRALFDIGVEQHFFYLGWRKAESRDSPLKAISVSDYHFKERFFGHFFHLFTPRRFLFYAGFVLS